jgi:hypothetical protein
MQDGKIMVSKTGHHYRASFWWDGSKHTSNAWYTREQAEAQAQQMLRSLGGTSRMFRKLGIAPGFTGRPILSPGSVANMSAGELRTIASGLGVPYASRLTKKEMVIVLTKMLEEPA